MRSASRRGAIPARKSSPALRISAASSVAPSAMRSARTRRPRLSPRCISTPPKWARSSCARGSRTGSSCWRSSLSTPGTGRSEPPAATPRCRCACPTPCDADPASLGPQMREQQHVADRRLVGEQHDNAVDADTEARGRRHAVFERANIVRVEEHRLLVSGVLARRLLPKPRRLVVRIVELGETVGQLATAHEELEAVRDEWIAVVASRQRRDLGGVRVHEGRLEQAVLGGTLEDLDLHLARAIPGLRFDAELRADAAQIDDVAELRTVEPGVEMHDQILDGHTAERLAKIVG